MGAAKRQNRINGRTAVDSMNRIERIAERLIMAPDEPPNHCARRVSQTWAVRTERETPLGEATDHV
jgi:hypothetical protein